jgi:hypothetical protein
MVETLEITAEAVRQNLLARVSAFRDRSGCSLSYIGEQALRDSKFIANVQRGDNFTIKTYQRVIDWLDAEEARAAA